MPGPVATIAVVVLFILTGCACVVRAVRNDDRLGRISAGIHLAACAVMVLMLRTWIPGALTAAVITAFVAAAGWYVSHAWPAYRKRSRSTEPSCAVWAAHHTSVPYFAYHAAMMLLMAWMTYSMPGDVGGMTMGSPHMTSMAGRAEQQACQLLGAALIPVSAWFVLRLTQQVAARASHRRSMVVTIDTAIDLGMAAGMAAMVLTMTA